MRCPECDREMIEKSRNKLERFYHWEDEEFYYRRITLSSYTCKYCGIQKREDGSWVVPKFFNPTEKQIKVIAFINNVLRMDIEPVTRTQCCRIIAKYMQASKEASERDRMSRALAVQAYLNESDFY